MWGLTLWYIYMEAAGSVIKEGEPQLQTGEPVVPTAKEVDSAKQEWPGLCPDKGEYSWETAEHNDWGQIFLLFSVVIMYYSTFLNWKYTHRWSSQSKNKKGNGYLYSCVNLTAWCFWLDATELGHGYQLLIVSLVVQTVKNLPAMQEMQVQFLDREDPLEKGMATHSNILAWRIPRTQETDRLYCME